MTQSSKLMLGHASGLAFFAAMTDVEYDKICKVLNASAFFLNTDGMMVVLFNDTTLGHLYIYEDSFSSALPLRMLVHGKHVPDTKKLLEYLLKQAADGISTMVVTPSKTGCLDKSKFITKDDTVESFLVKHDLMHSYKKAKKENAEDLLE